MPRRKRREAAAGKDDCICPDCDKDCLDPRNDCPCRAKCCKVTSPSNDPLSVENRELVHA